MKITLLAFGIVKDIFDSRQLEIELPANSTVVDLRTALHTTYPALGELAVYRIAINGEYSAQDAAIGDGDEIAIIPPVSGG